MPAAMRRVAASWERHAGIERFEDSPKRTSLLPGPAELSADVRRALAQRPISHRSGEFIEQFEQVRASLSEMTGAGRVAILCGSGTLANDAVAAALAADSDVGDGLILINGEFGARLRRQAGRHGLRFRTLNWAWGQPWDLSQVEDRLSAD